MSTGSTIGPQHRVEFEHMSLDDSFVTGGGLAVGGAVTLPGVQPVMAELTAEDVPARLAAGDATLWGPAAEAEAQIRLGWLALPRTSRELLDRLATLRAELRAAELTRVVLCGMGGSSLAPEVICRTLDVSLTVLDSTDPAQVTAAMSDLDRTVVVVSSKSGGTVETDSHRRAFWQAFLDAGLTEQEAGQRFVAVTDPGSPLASVAESMGARAIFLADPNVGGRYSALSAFGLVPAALAGVDVSALLDEADELAATLATGGPALALGTALGVAAAAGRDKVLLADDGTGILGLGDWIEQLLAESTGKEQTGILPVVVPTPEFGTIAADELTVTVGGALTPRDAISDASITVNAPLGAQFLAWEYATAIAGRLLEINPFDQPNVTESKENTAAILAKGALPTSSTTQDGVVVMDAANPPLDPDATVDLATELGNVLATIPAGGYLAVMAYLDRVSDAAATELRMLLAERTNRPVTFGWGPRFLHSTGQYHKGGPQNGVFLQITADSTQDLPVPGQPFTFGQLQAAQAAGDRAALQQRGRPLLHLHLTEREAGLAQLQQAVRSLPETAPATPKAVR